MDRSPSESRRRFLAETLRGACCAAAGTFAASLLSGCGGDDFTLAPVGDTEVEIDITQSRFQNLATVGGIVTLDPGTVTGVSGQGLFLIRDSTTSVLVLDRTCTHQGCRVGSFAGGAATCPCHGSRFNPQGGVVRGPAGRPLRRYPATLNDTLITFAV